MYKTTSGFLLTGALLAALLAGCSGSDDKSGGTSTEAPASATQQNAGQPASTQPSGAQATTTTTTTANPPATGASNLPTGGKVLRAMHAGGYTYMELENEGRQFWIASSMVNVKHNDRVTWASAALMKDFKSTSLRRTFDEILFVTAVKVEQ